MRVQARRRTPSTRLQHAAGFSRSQADLVARLALLVAAGLRRGEPVAMAVRPVTEEALLGVLGGATGDGATGDGATGLVLLSQPDGPDDSGQNVAARRARELRELTGGGTRAVTVVAEHISRFDGPDGGFWTELDAASNIALADLPVSLTCFFPELPLHAAVLEGARRNHPLLLVDGEPRANPDRRPPRDVLAEHPPAPPALLGPPDQRLTFGAWQLHEVRAAVEQAVLAADFTRDRAEDVVLAVNEVATNAVEHGAADAELAIWTDGGLVCEVYDPGVLDDPLPGLRPPHSSNPKGRGIWIARQLCDTLHVWADGTGTRVRMRAAR